MDLLSDMIDNPHMAGPGIFEILLYLARGYWTCTTALGDTICGHDRWQSMLKQLKRENDYVGIYGHSPPMCAHAHTNTHILSSSKASSHLFDTVITAHTDSNDGWSPSLGYTLSSLLAFFLISHSLFSHSLSFCAMISSWPHHVHCRRCITEMRWYHHSKYISKK